MKKISSFLAVFLLLCTFGARNSYSIDPPSTQAKFVGYTNVQYDQADVSWVNGTGNKRIVVISENPITATPTDDTEYYDANGNLGDGSIETLASGVYVIDVLSDPNNSTTFTGLTENTGYYVKVFEYNRNSGGSEMAYITSNATYNPSQFTTPLEVGTPNPLTPIDITYYSAVVRWSDVSGMPDVPDAGNHYYLDVIKASDNSVILQDYNVGANQNATAAQEWLVSGLAYNTQYKFRVKAKIGGTEGVWSSYLTFQTSNVSTPTVTSVTATPNSITADGSIQFEVVFNQTMNTSSTLYPALAFTPDVSSKLTFSYAQWGTTTNTNDTWTGYYTVDINTGDEYKDIDVNVTNAENLAGMAIASTDFADVFTIDANPPTVTLTITKNDNPAQHIKDGDEITVYAVFSEDMAAVPTVQITVDFATNASGTNTVITLVRLSATDYRYIGQLANEGVNSGLNGYIYLDDFTQGTDEAGNDIVDPTTGYTVYIDNTPPDLDAGADPDLSITNPATDAAGIELQSLTTLEGSASDTPMGQVALVQVAVIDDANGDGVNDSGELYFDGGTFTGANAAGGAPANDNENWLTASGLGPWTYGVTSTLPDGDYVMYVKVTDKAGNTSIDGNAFAGTADGSTTVRSRAFTIDNTAPETLLIAVPTDNDLVADATTIGGFNGTVTETNTLESVEYYVYNDANENGMFDAGEPVYNPSTNAFAGVPTISWNDVDNFANGTPGSWDVDTEFVGSIDAAMNTLATGTVKVFKFNVRATDKAGNVTATVTHTVTVDNQVPTGYLTYTDAENGGNVLTEVNSTATVYVNSYFTEDMSNDVEITDGSVEGPFINTGTPSAMTENATDASIYYYVATNLLGDGTVDVTYTDGTDLAGNAVTAAPTSGGTGLIVDNTEPITHILTPADGAYLSSLTTISGTINETNTIDEVEYDITNTSTSDNYKGSSNDVTPAVTFNNTAATWEIDFSALSPAPADGVYDVLVWTTDLAGNEESTPASISFTLDATGPVVTIVTPVDNDLRTDFPVFDGSAGDVLELAGVHVSLKKLTNQYGDPVNMYWNGVSNTFASASPYWNVANTDDALPFTGTTGWDYDDQSDLQSHDTNIDGTYEITVRGTDGSGNTTTETHTFEIDNTAPQLVSIVRSNPTPTANPHLTNNNTVEFTVTFDEDVTGVTADDFTYLGTAGVTSGDAVVAGSGDTYTVTVTIPTDGTVALELDPSGLAADDIEDIAGNDLSGSTATSMYYDYDGTNPMIGSFIRSNPVPTADPHITNDFTLEFEFVANEDVVNVTTDDFILRNDGTDAVATYGAVTGISGSGDTYTITATMTGDETVYLEINSSNDIEDLYGNAFVFTSPVLPPGTPSGVDATDETTGSYLYDGTAPTATFAQDDADPTNAASVSWSVDWSEEVTNFNDLLGGVNPTFTTTGTVAYTGYSVAAVDVDEYTVTVTGITGDGTIAINVPAGVTDLATNTSSAYNNEEAYTIDNTLPYVVTIVRHDPVPSGDPYEISQVNAYFLVTFNEDVVDVDADDFAINQTNPITPQLVTKGDVWATDVTGTDDYGTSSASTYWMIEVTFVGDATASITIDPTDPALEITDEATNELGGSAVTSLRYRYDNTDPYVVTYINQNPTYVTNPTYTNASSVNYRVQFNEPVNNVDATDFTVNGTSGGSLGTVTNESGNYIYNLPVTFGSEGTVSVQLDGTDDIVDLASNTLQASSYALTSGEYVYDATAPVVYIDNTEMYLNSVPTITGEVEEANPLASFYSGTTDNDVEVQIYNGTNYWNGTTWVGTATWIDITSAVTDPGTTYDYAWTYTMPSLVDGDTYDVNVRSTDAAGNVSNTETYTFTYDVTPPEAAITYSVSSPYEVNESTVVTITATFTEDVKDAPAPAFTLSGFGPVTLTKTSATVYTYDYTVPTGNFTLNIGFTSGEDLAGNAIVTDPASGDNTLIIDNTAPTVTIDPITTPTNSISTITGTYTETNTIDQIDVVLTDGITTYNLADMAPAAGTWTVNVPALTDGTWDVSVTGTDAAGNTTDPAVTTSFVYDETPPTVVSITPSTDQNVGGTLPFTVTYTVEFSEEIANFDYTLNPTGSIATSGTDNVTTTDNITFTIEVQLTAGNDGDEINLSVDNTTDDLAGNTYAGSDASGNYIIDVTPPTATITRDDATPTNATSVNWSVDWSEEVTNFGDGVGDVNPTFAVSGVSYTGYTVTTTDGINYTVTVNGISGDGTIDISVATGVDDLFGNTSTVAYTNEAPYTIDQTAPYVTGTTPTNGATDVNPFNSIVFTISEDVYDAVGGALGDVITIQYGSPLSTLSASEYDVTWNNSGASTTVTIDPTPGTLPYFPDNTIVQVTIDDDEVYDMATNELDRASTTITFQTANVPDAPTNFIAYRILQNLVELHWTNGADAEGNILWGNDFPATDDSMDETDLDPSTPNRIYGTGDLNNDGQYYALYKGPADKIIITGLHRDRTYKMRLYGYEGAVVNPLEADVTFTTYLKDDEAFEVVAGVQGLSIGNIYPNPVSDQFAFNFNLTNSSDVTVEIVNTLGNVIAVPVNNEAYAQGVHNLTVKLDNSNISSGTYFLRVTANGQQVVRPLSIIK